MTNLRLQARLTLLSLLLCAGLSAAPTTVDDVLEIPRPPYEGIAIADVLSNDDDPSGELLEVTNAVGITVGAVPSCASFGTITTLAPGGGYTNQLVVFTFTSMTRPPDPPPGEVVSCWIRYTATNESGGSATGLLGLRSQTALFADGFESGNTSAWSAVE